ncbi:MAG: hypothetical protein KGY54_07905 [Oleiphilaceae bacterium]|nr:hypothetical protein [Oleiphilaceae bacterium]
MHNSDEHHQIPDLRDGLNAKQRAVLLCLRELQKSRGGRMVPTAMLYGRVVEHTDMSVDEMQAILQRFIGVHGA